MKTIIITIVLACTLAFMNAQDAIKTEGTTITVTVPVKTDTGEIIVALYNEATFMKAAPLEGLRSTIENGKATVVFTNIAPGDYGITLFHDTNGNKTMDFEANGMPKENYGVSNNVMNFGPPQWKDAKFTIATAPIEMEIIL
ncbi:DUF2141 domain-containing protein [Rasiella sp. SM2506]|uniref:DUF2141 domain-containing protein n=1 Tax=Rasiella sp. SM2506 TaxID=3423914 RepID=UPI003D7B5087